MKAYRRRKTVVDQKVQYRILIYNWVYFLIITIFIAVALFLPLSLRLNDSGLSWVQQGNLSRTVLFLHGNLWPAVLIVFILLSLHSLLISNKIVGPLKRFHGALQDFAKGTPWATPVLRRDDLLFDDLSNLSSLIESIQRRMDRIRVEHQEMERLIQDMAATLDSGDPSGDIRARVLRISQQQARIKRIIEGPGAPGSGHVDASSPQ